MRTVIKTLTNKKMNDEVYVLRRKVIDIIYLLKKHVDLPRIEVRITDSHKQYLGMATLDENTTIWITEESVNMSAAQLLHVVAHEIGHAVYKLKHSEKCKLMGPNLNEPADLQTIVQVFKKAAKR